MTKRHQDLSYFLHITLLNFIPLPQQINKFNKKSLLNAQIIRNSISPMFVSQQNIVTAIDSPIKPFAFQGKISFSQKIIKFSIKLSDLNKNFAYFLKIQIVDDLNKTQLSSFKLYMNKYIEAFKVQQKNYFQQNFFEKNGSRFQTEVYIETNRAALEYLLADIKSQKRKKRSLSIKKNRDAKNVTKNQSKALTIEKLHKQAEDKKNLRKVGQQNSGMKKNNIRNSAQSFDEYDQQQKLEIEQQMNDQELKQKNDQQKINQEKDQDSFNQERSKLENDLSVNRKTGQRSYGLEMSKITEVLNSENHSEMQRTNVLEAFSRERQNLLRTDYSQKFNTNTDRILQAIDMSQPTASVISSIIQQNPSLHAEIIDKHLSQLNMNEPGTNLSSLTDEFESFMSRSFIEADGGDEVSLVHSSELSVRTELQTRKIKRNKIMYVVLITLAFFIICWLIIPTNHHQKYLQKRTKNLNKRTKKTKNAKK